MINKQANTKVIMKGKIDDVGFYKGRIEGSTTNELYNFLTFVEKKRGKAFERVDIRLAKQNPLTYDCLVKFDTNIMKAKGGFLKKLFGLSKRSDNYIVADKKGNIYDKFEPLQKLEKKNFTFKPIRYEIWIGGKMVGNGKTNSLISAKVIKQNDTEKVVVFFDASFNNELASTNTFDEFITSTDRQQLIIIPEETNVENLAINMTKFLIGATRKRKDFSENEPFACNLFLQNGIIVKVTFSFSNPEKLIEFHS